MVFESVVSRAIFRVRLFFEKRIWASEVGLPPWKRFIFEKLRILYVVFQGYRSHQCQAMAGSLTYTFLLAAVPSLAVILVLFQGPLLALKDEALTKALELLAPAPELQQPLRDGFQRGLDTVEASLSKGRALSASMGILVLVVTATMLLHRAEGFMNRIFGVTRSRSFVDKFTIYWAVATIGPALFVLSFSFTSETLLGAASRVAPLGLQSYLKSAVAVGFSVLALTVIYLWLPNTRVPIKAALVGGITAGLAFEGCKWGFIKATGLLMVRFSEVYGSISVLFVVLLWLYICFSIVLLGAELACAYQTVSVGLRGDPSRHFGQEDREKLALEAAHAVACRFHEGKGPAHALELAEDTRVPPPVMKEILDALEVGGILVSTEGGYLPARDIATITAWDVVNGLRTAGSQTGDRRSHRAAGVLESYERAREASRERLGKSSLRDHVLACAGGGGDRDAREAAGAVDEVEEEEAEVA